MDSRVVLIVGAGDRLGSAIAKKFLGEGFHVLLLSRNINNLTKLKRSLTQNAGDIDVYSADVADTVQLTNQFELIKRRYERIDVIIYNAASIVNRTILDEREEAVLYDFRVNVVGLLTTAVCFESQLKKSAGALLVTGGGIAIYPKPDYASLSITSAALFAMVRCLSFSLKSLGVFVGTILVNGKIAENCPLRKPQYIADQFWRLYNERETVEILL